jgi:ABC-2 type transport system ATP-binding protein
LLLEIENLVKQYKNGPRANDCISLAIEQGEVFGLLGPNGAGKTTLINQIIGLKVPTSGSIKVDGIDVVANPDYARKKLFVPSSNSSANCRINCNASNRTSRTDSWW